jgi:hypothetical protein
MFALLLGRLAAFSARALLDAHVIGLDDFPAEHAALVVLRALELVNQVGSYA